MRKGKKSTAGAELIHGELDLKALPAELTARAAGVSESSALLEENAAQIKQATEQLAQRDDTIRDLRTALHEKHTTQRDFDEIRRALEKQTVLTEELTSKVDRLLIHQSEIQTSNDDLQALLVARGVVLTKEIEYRQLVRRIREVVRGALPPETKVVVVSKGDSELLNLEGRQGWHFPQTKDGAYAGFYPVDSVSAIAQLEALRDEGADYVLFPETAFWWLQHYAAFSDHLDRNYRVVHRSNDACLIFALRTSNPWREVAELIAEFKKRSRRFPAILDWESDVDLAKTFPECAVFAPMEPDNNSLPYLKESIDIVAVNSGVTGRLEEARRVASEAVLIIRLAGGGKGDLEVTIEKHRNGAANVRPEPAASGCNL